MESEVLSLRIHVLYSHATLKSEILYFKNSKTIDACYLLMTQVTVVTQHVGSQLVARVLDIKYYVAAQL